MLLRKGYGKRVGQKEPIAAALYKKSGISGKDEKCTAFQVVLVPGFMRDRLVSVMVRLPIYDDFSIYKSLSM